ncbi:glyoxal oxidase-related protein [Forsythia ovata]|uniref:Glyoxal oxidase-related protein n=1 Tax=Forsythia ovata TaxID=205694 RepID=A0ABD1SJE4_9LAMI
MVVQWSNELPLGKIVGDVAVNLPNSVWEMKDKPFGSIMGDMVMLPTGDVLIINGAQAGTRSLIINGAQAGTQGFEMASQPCLFSVLYRSSELIGLQFMTLNSGLVSRTYHSTANLLSDGRILITGSNPHYFYKFSVEFPTEFRIEAFSLEYLSPDKANIRPLWWMSQRKWVKEDDLMNDCICWARKVDPKIEESFLRTLMAQTSWLNLKS